MNRTEEKRVTIKDIARETQYSIASIHCALNGKPGVSEEARQYIRETAQRMGYRPNSVAVSLKRKGSRRSRWLSQVQQQITVTTIQALGRACVIISEA